MNNPSVKNGSALVGESRMHQNDFFGLVCQCTRCLAFIWLSLRSIQGGREDVLGRIYTADESTVSIQNLTSPLNVMMTAPSPEKMTVANVQSAYTSYLFPWTRICSRDIFRRTTRI
jgi:hypothetical protein